MIDEDVGGGVAKLTFSERVDDDVFLSWSCVKLEKKIYSTWYATCVNNLGVNNFRLSCFLILEFTSKVLCSARNAILKDTVAAATTSDS